MRQLLNVDDSVRDRFNVRLTPGQMYRVEVELECFLRVDVISFTAVDCNAESDDRGVFVNQLKVLLLSRLPRLKAFCFFILAGFTVEIGQNPFHGSGIRMIFSHRILHDLIRCYVVNFCIFNSI